MTISEIKKQLSILAVLGYYGIKPNRNTMVCCPFHDDKNPSMKVYPDTVFCFSGNCCKNGKAMDVIQFIQDKENITKHEAILKAQSLIEAPTQVAPKPILQPENLSEIFAKLRPGFYGSSKAIAYAERRNIYTAKLEAGYNNGTHYKKLKNCIVFPLKERENNIVSFYGRNIESKGKDDRHFYLPGRSGLYPGYPDAATETIIITESIIDAATLHLYTTYKALSLYGTNVLNYEHQEALQSLPHLKQVIMFLNGDEAGMEWFVK